MHTVEVFPGAEITCIRALMPIKPAERMPYPIPPISSSSASHSAADFSSAGSGPLATSSTALRGNRQPFTSP